VNEARGLSKKIFNTTNRAIFTSDCKCIFVRSLICPTCTTRLSFDKRANHRIPFLALSSSILVVETQGQGYSKKSKSTFGLLFVPAFTKKKQKLN
jgi:hypothetical protein